MKKIVELDKEELIGFIYNNLPTLNIWAKYIECAVCGKTDKAKYYYICTDCNERLK